MAEFIDYYEILQVHPNADADVIDAAYKKLIFKHHPDRGGDEEVAKRITAAYWVLRDPVRRRDYDAKRAAASSATTGTRSSPEPVVEIVVPPEIIDEILAAVWVEGAKAAARVALRSAMAVVLAPVAMAEIARQREAQRAAEETERILAADRQRREAERRRLADERRKTAQAARKKPAVRKALLELTDEPADWMVEWLSREIVFSGWIGWSNPVPKEATIAELRLLHEQTLVPGARQRMSAYQRSRLLPKEMRDRAPKSITFAEVEQLQALADGTGSIADLNAGAARMLLPQELNSKYERWQRLKRQAAGLKLQRVVVRQDDFEEWPGAAEDAEAAADAAARAAAEAAEAVGAAAGAACSDFLQELDKRVGAADDGPERKELVRMAYPGLAEARRIQAMASATGSPEVTSSPRETLAPGRFTGERVLVFFVFGLCVLAVLMTLVLLSLTTQ